MRLLKEVEAICRRINDPAGCQPAWESGGDPAGHRGPAGAMRLHKEQEAILSQAQRPAGYKPA